MLIVDRRNHGREASKKGCECTERYTGLGMPLKKEVILYADHTMSCIQARQSIAYNLPRLPPQ